MGKCAFERTPKSLFFAAILQFFSWRTNVFSPNQGKQLFFSRFSHYSIHRLSTHVQADKKMAVKQSVGKKGRIDRGRVGWPENSK
jgi:hypothetical protein